MHGDDAGPQNLYSLIERQGRALAERSESDDPSATVVQKPAAVFRHEAVIHLKVRIKTSCNCGHDAVPIHWGPRIASLNSGCESFTLVARLSTLVGNNGGRIDSAVQPSRNWVAGAARLAGD